MKKWITLVALPILALISFFVFKPNKQNSSPTSIPLPSFNVNLTIDYGNKNINSYQLTADSASTAYSILKKTLEKENIYYEVQQYDFGVFVKKIGDLESGSKKAWIYYVNDVSGDKAADQYILKNNDKVTWKYEEAKY